VSQRSNARKTCSASSRLPAQARERARTWQTRGVLVRRQNDVTGRSLLQVGERWRRVFVIVDNGSVHRGQRSIDRLQGTWDNLRLIHTPIDAIWLNQAEIYLSVVQRTAISPNDFADLDTLEQHLLAFGRRHEQIATPVEWKFTRADLDQLLNRVDRPTAPGHLTRRIHRGHEPMHEDRLAC
jgi:hypothetical protein